MIVMIIEVNATSNNTNTNHDVTILNTGWRGCIQPQMSLSRGLSSKINIIFAICIPKYLFVFVRSIFDIYQRRIFDLHPTRIYAEEENFENMRKFFLRGCRFFERGLQSIYKEVQSRLRMKQHNLIFNFERGPFHLQPA